MDRAVWIAAQRQRSRERMDTLWAPIYDQHWGASIDPAHRRMLERFLAVLPPRANVLDAACGTGTYWPVLLGAGHRLQGIDQSGGMLAHARAKHPAVPVEQIGLQELAFGDAFDGITCIDAMEYLFPEHWPVVLRNVAHALRAGGVLYVTIELPEPDLAEVHAAAVAAGLPVVAGEYAKDGAYHYYPSSELVGGWLDEAGFELVEETIGDDYQHLLLRKAR